MPTERQERIKVKDVKECGAVAQVHTVRTSMKWIAPTKELLEKTSLGENNSFEHILLQQNEYRILEGKFKNIFAELFQSTAEDLIMKYFPLELIGIIQQHTLFFFFSQEISQYSFIYISQYSFRSLSIL